MGEMSAHDPQAAFIERLEEHRGILFKVANAYCRNPANREDLVQDMAVQLWRAYRRYDGRSSFSTWMYRIAVNVAISFYRSETRKGRDVLAAEPATFDRFAAPTQDPETDERLTFVREFIDQLDELNRALMVLYLDDNSYAEIAAILGISETNAATKIGRIKQKLKGKVAAQGRG
jgi:RNA polymerase sigma-70 factor (ECF subfamily)